MRTRQLLTDAWHIKQLPETIPDPADLARAAAAPDDTWLPARMPAQVHDVLLAHGRIADPRVGRNAAAAAWVGEQNWAYTCTFATPTAHGPILLHFDGLDTLATASVNGTAIGSFDDMFRAYEVDVRACLNPAGLSNVLLIVFRSPLRFVAAVAQPPEHVGRIGKHTYLRKAANDFNTYLGARPHFAKVGVYRNVVLDVPDRAWIADVWVRTELVPDLTHATLHVAVIARGDPAVIGWVLLDPSGEQVHRGAAATGNGTFTIEIDDPQLWWPWTHGTPHLYRLQISLQIAGETVDHHVVPLGIRDVRPVLDDSISGEQRFQFAINGRLLFLQGANWVPVEGMSHCWDHGRALRLLDLAQEGRMNMLRVWAGGYIPPAAFYDECDRRGILLWQDFMFEYGMHPTGEAAFDATCRAEVEGLIRQLRNHPSILLWCGGNENYMGWDFDIGGEPTIGRDLFEQLIPDACARLDPGRLYHPSSPYGGHAPNWPLAGDWHDYTWRGFSHGAAVPRFISEGGRASAMSAACMRRFLDADAIWPDGFDPAIRTPGQAAWPPMWQYRSVDGAWVKVGAIDAFCDPRTAEDLIRVLGTAHGEYLQRTVERYRRGVPDDTPAGDGARRGCGGYLVWRLNDAWPINYYSVVDYDLVPKIPFYFLRRAFTPVLVCFERTLDRLAVWVVNDSPAPVTGRLIVRRLRFDGALIGYPLGERSGMLEKDVELQPGEARRVLDTVALGPIRVRDELLQASFAEQEATYLLVGERHLHLPRARLGVRKMHGRIEVSTDIFGRQIVLEAPGAHGALFEDNYFDLAPGQTRVVNIVDHVETSEIVVRAYNADPVSV
jgi:hypothetical protein